VTNPNVTNANYNSNNNNAAEETSYERAFHAYYWNIKQTTHITKQ